MEDKIIKELAKQIEKEKEKNNKNLFNENLTKKEINEIYSSEKISNENNIDTYSIINNFSENKIKELSLKKKKLFKFYNEKIGEFSFKSFLSEKENFLYKNSYISNLLKDSEILNLIIYNNEFDIHDQKNFYPLFYKYCNNYRDIQLCCNNLEIRENLMKIYLFHIINHVLKRKEEIEINDNIEKIINNNNNNTNSEKLEKILFRSHEEEFIENYYKTNHKYFNNNQAINKNNFYIFNKIIKKKYSFSDLDTINIKDQGFTSPKILILVPYKKHAKIIIEEMVSILKGNWNGISNKKKFKDEYSEFESLDDCFRMGISFDYFENKINLYSPFVESDIIICSPLGLKLSIQTDNENKKVFDFLSSIEILLIDFSEIFIYQNLEHLNEILNFVNKIPKNNQNLNSILRIKDLFSNNLSKFLRQTICISHFKTMDIDNILNEFCNENINGRIIFKPDYENQIEKIKYELNEKYQNLNFKDYEIRFEFKMLFDLKNENYYDEKFNYFTKNIWINLYESFEKHTIIFVSSTFDYLRLKSFFKQKSKAVCFIDENTDKRDWQRNRLFFEQGKYKFLLYNERGHFFKKINLKFAKNIFFYSLPEDPKIFYEMIELIDPVKYKENLIKYEYDSEQNDIQNYASVISLVSVIDKYNIEKILGKLGKKIMKEKKEYYSC